MAMRYHKFYWFYENNQICFNLENVILHPYKKRPNSYQQFMDTTEGSKDQCLSELRTTIRTNLGHDDVENLNNMATFIISQEMNLDGIYFLHENFCYFDSDIQKMIIKAFYLFCIKSNEPDILLKFMTSIDAFSRFYDGDLADLSGDAYQLFFLVHKIEDEKYRIHCLRAAVKLLAIHINPDMKSDEFYQMISQYILNFGDKVNFTELFIRLINAPPLPPSNLIEIMVPHVFKYSQMNCSERTIWLSLRFLFQAHCNSIEFDYSPFVSLFPNYLSLNKKKLTDLICVIMIRLSSFNDELILLLLDIISKCSISNRTLKMIIELFFRNLKSYEIIKKSPFFQQIMEIVVKNVKSDDLELRGSSIDSYLMFKTCENMPFDLEFAKLLIENIDLIKNQDRAMFYIDKWVLNDSNLTDDELITFMQIIHSEYEHLETIAQLDGTLPSLAFIKLTKPLLEKI
ncbi:hypothetical protein TRFO_02073 [Tritrichomonas foetus]|uniref:Uncharacterized protein n=1 Tax=Tritrichomonas foetus TaxID=1144522 RepID=A0A1J4JCL2_9EUKA|nr:hypothetical protein TRFO_02073 [Tritrichomonas foetus]|eukprot:OHS96938.1 hypothetical protein TRFO_02073 [Tritrichomonas foetus]